MDGATAGGTNSSCNGDWRVWLPNWPVQRLRAARPELTGQAFVVYDPHARDGSRVTTCSDLALRQGVRPGMPLAEAQTLLTGSGVFFDQRRSPHEKRPVEKDSRPRLAEPALCCLPHDAALRPRSVGRVGRVAVSSSVRWWAWIRRMNRIPCCWT